MYLLISLLHNFLNKLLMEEKLGEGDNPFNFRVYVIWNAQFLSHDAQASLRRALEDCDKRKKVWMVSSNVNNLIPPIRSRCVIQSLNSPKNEEIAKLRDDRKGLLRQHDLNYAAYQDLMRLTLRAQILLKQTAKMPLSENDKSFLKEDSPSPLAKMLKLSANS